MFLRRLNEESGRSHFGVGVRSNDNQGSAIPQHDVGICGICGRIARIIGATRYCVGCEKTTPACACLRLGIP
jgi:hypothetical protein